MIMSILTEFLKQVDEGMVFWWFVKS